MYLTVNLTEILQNKSIPLSTAAFPLCTGCRLCLALALDFWTTLETKRTPSPCNSHMWVISESSSAHLCDVFPVIATATDKTACIYELTGTALINKNMLSLVETHSSPMFICNYSTSYSTINQISQEMCTLRNNITQLDGEMYEGIMYKNKIT